MRKKYQEEDSSTHYFFGLNFNLNNRIHKRAKDNLEKISKLTGLNKSQSFLLTMSLVNPQDIVDYLAGGNISISPVERRELREQSNSTHSAQNIEDKNVIDNEIEDVSGESANSIMNLFNM